MTKLQAKLTAAKADLARQYRDLAETALHAAERLSENGKETAGAYGIITTAVKAEALRVRIEAIEEALETGEVA